MFIIFSASQIKDIMSLKNYGMAQVIKKLISKKIFGHGGKSSLKINKKDLESVRREDGEADIIVSTTVTLSCLRTFCIR